jgi:hypothetical protein
MQLVALDERLAKLPGLEPSSVRAPNPQEAGSGAHPTKSTLRLHPVVVGAGRGLGRFVWVPVSAAAAAILAVWTSLWLPGTGEHPVPPTPAVIGVPTDGLAVRESPRAAHTDVEPVVIGPAYIDAIAFGGNDNAGDPAIEELGLGGDGLLDLSARDLNRLMAELARRSPERAEIVREYLRRAAADAGSPAIMPPEPPSSGPPAVPLELRIVRVDENTRR